MKDTAEAIDRLLSNFGTILRYIAPGFAALFVVAAIVPESRAFLLSGSPTVAVLAMLLGPTIYGVHTGAVLRYLWWPVVCCQKKDNKTAWQAISELDEQRWLRRASEEVEVKAIQGEMEKWAAMLNLLYCLSYTLILIPVVARALQPRWSVSSDWCLFPLAGLVVFVAALVSEWFITAKEIRLSEMYRDGKKANR